MDQRKPVWLMVVMIVVIVAVVNIAPQAHSQPPGDQWVLTFSDEFDSPVLDRSRWNSGWYPGAANVGNGQRQFFVDDALLLENGRLRIRADRRTYLDKPYTSGMVHTRDKFSQRYGYFEIRARWPKGNGLWSAFWFLPKSQGFPPEIDFEFLGKSPYSVFSNIHYLDSAGQHGQSNYWYHIGTDMSAGFHTYAIQWTPDQVIWYVDGVEFRRFTNTASLPQEPMYLLLDLSVGGWWDAVGSPDDTSFPQFFEIDYVRVWQKPGWAALEPTPTPTAQVTTTPTATATAASTAAATPTLAPAQPTPATTATGLPTTGETPVERPGLELNPSPTSGAGLDAQPTGTPTPPPDLSVHLPLIQRP